MPDIPQQRRQGSKGPKGGRGGHSKNRELSGRRGGSPGASKPPRKGSGGGSKAMVALAAGMLAVPVTGIGYVAYVVAAGNGWL